MWASSPGYSVRRDRALYYEMRCAHYALFFHRGLPLSILQRHTRLAPVFPIFFLFSSYINISSPRRSKTRSSTGSRTQVISRPRACVSQAKSSLSSARVTGVCTGRSRWVALALVRNPPFRASHCFGHLFVVLSSFPSLTPRHPPLAYK